jgi:hypothetical protein
MLFPFPTENKDKERRQRWIKNFNRKDPNTGKLWNPTYNDNLQLCNLRKSAFQFLKWYVLFEHPTTAQIHVEFFNNLK